MSHYVYMQVFQSEWKTSTLGHNSVLPAAMLNQLLQLDPVREHVIANADVTAHFEQWAMAVANMKTAMDAADMSLQSLIEGHRKSQIPELVDDPLQRVFEIEERLIESIRKRQVLTSQLGLAYQVRLDNEALIPGSVKPVKLKVPLINTSCLFVDGCPPFSTITHLLSQADSQVPFLLKLGPAQSWHIGVTSPAASDQPVIELVLSSPKWRTDYWAIQGVSTLLGWAYMS